MRLHRIKIYIILLSSAIQAQENLLSEKIEGCLQEIGSQRPINSLSQDIGSEKLMDYIHGLIAIQPELGCGAIAQGLLTLLEHTFIYEERIKLIVGRLANHPECAQEIILAVFRHYPQMFEDSQHSLTYNLNPLINMVRSLVKVDARKWQPRLDLLQDDTLQEAFDAQVKEMLPRIMQATEELETNIATASLEQIQQWLDRGASFWSKAVWRTGAAFSKIIERLIEQDKEAVVLKHLLAMVNKKSFRAQVIFRNAVIKNNVKAMELLLTQGATIQQESLKLAIRNNATEAASFLFEHGEKLSNPYKYIEMALRDKNSAMVKLIFEHMPDLRIPYSDIELNLELLMRAIDNKDSNSILLLLEHGANPNLLNEKDNLHALALAIFNKLDLNIISLLIQYGSAVNPSDNSIPPLIAAIETSNFEAADFLIRHGAKSNVRLELLEAYGEISGKTPLQIALDKQKKYRTDLSRGSDDKSYRNEKYFASIRLELEENAKIIELLKRYNAV